MAIRTVTPRRRFARLLSGVVVLGMSGAIAAPAIAGLGSLPTTTDDGAVSEDIGSVVASTTNFGPPVMGAHDTLRVNVLVENSSMTAAEDVEVSVAMTTEPFESREDLAHFLAEPHRASTETVAELLVGTEVDSWTEEDGEGEEEEFETVLLPPGESTTESIPVRVNGSPLSQHRGTWGVFGLTVTVTHGGSRTVVDTLAFTWADADMPELPLSIVVTASGTPPRVDALLTAGGHSDVALVVDPVTISPLVASTTGLGERELYRLPAFNPDSTSLAHADDDYLLTFALERSALDAPRSLRENPWLGLAPTLDESTLTLLQEAGAVAALVDPRFGAEALNLANEDDATAPPVASVTLASASTDFPLIVPDTGLSELLATYRTGQPGTPSRLVAEAAMIAASNPDGVPVVISPGPSWVIDGTQPSPSIEALFDASFIEPTPLAAALSFPGQPKISVPELTATDTDLPPADVQALSERFASLQALAETVENPRGLVDRFSSQVFSVVALDARFASEDRSASAAQLVESLDETLGAVSITSGSALNLVAASGDVPITISNDLDVDSTVRVRMNSRAPELRITDQPVVTVPAQSTVTVGVPVTAVSSANVTVNVILETESGRSISPVQHLDIRVRADWGNAVTAVFTGGLVLLLIAGLVRTIRRGRKDTRTGPADEATLAEAPREGNTNE